ncbi:MAG: hypothetical protein KAH32_06885 [Chlamydiia bacterium]|nr:hypothetical protein [Chlamydiia bacterium]
MIRAILPMLVTMNETATLDLIPAHLNDFMTTDANAWPILLSLSDRLSTTLPLIDDITTTRTNKPMRATGTTVVNIRDGIDT